MSCPQVQCFQTSISNTFCSPTDIPCLCGDQAFLGAVQGCQAQSCTIKEILSTKHLLELPTITRTDRVLASTNATLAACGVAPGDQSATIIGIPASFGSLAILLVLIRVFGRLWITKVDLDWDDYLIVFAVVSLVQKEVFYATALGHTLNYYIDICLGTQLRLLS